MVPLMMLLALLGVGDFNRPLTQEEIDTRKCHEYCDGVQGRIETSIAESKKITDTGTCNNGFNINSKEYDKSA